MKALGWLFVVVGGVLIVLGIKNVSIGSVLSKLKGSAKPNG